MNLKKIRWKNFNSYGAEETELILDGKSSLNLLVGRNGSGKSSLREAITFALYGTVPSKTQKRIVNRINKNLEVHIEFTSKGRYVKLSRGLEPSFLNITIDDKDHSDIAGKRNVEKIISNLIGIPYKIYNNIITLDINKYVSFISLSNKDKREIIDRLFGIEDITLLYEYLKEEIKDNKRLIETKMTQKDWSFSKIQDLQKQIEVVYEKEQQKQKIDVNSNIQKIEELDDKINKAKSNTKKYEDNKLKIKEKLNLYSKQIKKYDNEIHSLKKQFKLIDQDACPVCETDLTGDFHINLRQKIETSVNENNEKKVIINKKIDELYKKLDLSDKEITKYLNLINKASLKKREYVHENKQIEKLNQQKIDILTEQIQKNEIDIKQIEDDLIDVYNERQVLMDTETVLNEDGFRKQLILTLLPGLNRHIQRFSKILNLDYTLEFDNDLHVILTHFGREIDHETLSTGEQKKLDLVVLFSLMTLVKVKYTDMNLLFIDEIFSGLDIETQNYIVDILATLVERLNIHCFVINHSDLGFEKFNNIYEMKKINGFSHMEQIRNEVNNVNE